MSDTPRTEKFLTSIMFVHAGRNTQVTKARAFNDLVDYAAELERELAAVTTERDALLKDKERLDANLTGFIFKVSLHGCVDVVQVICEGTEVYYHSLDTNGYGSLREAIQAAIDAAKGGAK